MHWGASGVIVEFAGLVIVVLSLFYLAKQIRQNSDALNRANDFARAGSISASNSLYVQVFSGLVADPERASIYRRATNGGSLDEDESTRFAAFVNTFCAYAEALFHQHVVELGYYAEFGAEELVDIWGPYLHKLLTTAAGNICWETDAPHLYTQSFITAVNQTIKP